MSVCQHSVVNTFTGQAEAGDVNVDVDYQLLPIAGGDEPIASGNVTQFVAYDRSSQRFRTSEPRETPKFATPKSLRIKFAPESPPPWPPAANDGRRFASGRGSLSSPARDRAHFLFLVFGSDQGLIFERVPEAARVGSRRGPPAIGCNLIDLSGDAIASDPLVLVDEANSHRSLWWADRTIRIQSRREIDSSRA